MAVLIGIRNIVTQAANLVKVNDTLVDTDLVIPIAANQSFRGRFWGIFTLAGVASGVKFQLTVPAAGTLYQLIWKIYDTATPAVIFDAQVASAAFSNALAAIDTYFVEGTFDVANGVNAGNVALQFAQLVTDAGAATFLAGASMEITKF